MKLQNTETTKRLNTLSQTKNTQPFMWAAKPTRHSAKNAFATGNSRARGRRALSQPNTGTRASIATKVAVNSHCSDALPMSTAAASRTGRRR